MDVVSKREWRRGDDNHKALAEWMYYRTAAQQGFLGESVDLMWEDQSTRGYWMTEAWATLEWIHERCKEPAQKKPLGPEWKVPRLCSDGIHDFRMDEAAGLVYCGKCDYWGTAD